MSGLFAYVPFLYPLNALHDWWYVLILPLALGLSMVYKAMRVNDLSRYWHDVVTMTIQIILGILALALALHVLVQWVIPTLPVD